MTKYIGFTSKLDFTVSTSFDTQLGQVISIEGPSAERGDVDTTTLDGTDEYRTFIAGLCDPGVVNLEIAYDPINATQKAITDLLDSGDETTFQITASDDAATVVASFSGYVKGWSPSFPLDDLMVATVTIKCSGDPVWPS